MIASLKLSALRVANIPPPMSLRQIDLAKNAIDVAISASNKRVAVLSENDVSIYAIDIHKKPIPTPSVLWHRLYRVTITLARSLLKEIRTF
jgi:elongator complex protein 1